MLQLRAATAYLRPSHPSHFHPQRPDGIGLPSGSLLGPSLPRSRANSEPASGTYPYFAALADRLGCILLDGPPPLCPPLVGLAASGRVARELPHPAVLRRHLGLPRSLPNHAGGTPARSAAACQSLCRNPVPGAEYRRRAAGER